MSAMLEAALALAARGFAVHPLRARAKVPLLPEWPNQGSDAPARIREWWSRWPNANIGIVTGAPSGVWVFDLDTDHERAWALLRECGAPDTLRARTAKGWHLYFRLTPGVSIPTRARIEIEGTSVGWDVRGTGGNIVAPPSVHPSGSVYAWDVDCEPQPAPDALVRLVVAKPQQAQSTGRTTRVRRPAAYADATIARAAQEVSTAPPGTRNATLFRAAARALEVAGALEAHAPGATTRALQQLEAAAAQAGLEQREVDATIASAERSARPALTLVGEPSDLPVPALEVDDRPLIRVVAGALVEAVDELEDALAAAGAIYVHAGRLVRVNGADPLMARARGLQHQAPEALVIRAYEAPAELTYASDRVARFARAGKRGEPEWVPTHPPGSVCAALLGKGDWGKAPGLRGVARAPFLRSDGTVAQAAGYDAQSATLLVPMGEFPPVPESPSRDDALRAAAVLLHPVREFPFVHRDDQAVWLASVLTMVARPAIDGPVPAFGFSANIKGTGKGKLAEIAAIIAHGHDPAMAPPTYDDREIRKRLTAFVVEGLPVVVWDNVKRPVGGSALEMALTCSVYSDRELGASRTIHAPMRLVFLVTGNNISTTGDFSRRILISQLMADTAAPEERIFEDKAVVQTAKRTQPELLCAALTMLRAFEVAGRPQRERAPLGSYEAWDALVRGCLAWLELGDPVGEPRQRIKDRGDEELEAVRALLLAWLEHFGEREVSASQVLREAFGREDFQEALLPFVGERESLKAKALGDALRQRKDCPVVLPGWGVVHLERARTDRMGIALWRVVVRGVSK